MTGRYTVRLGTQANVIFWDTPWGVPINETFVGQNLQDVGYDTAMFGEYAPVRVRVRARVLSAGCVECSPLSRSLALSFSYCLSRFILPFFKHFDSNPLAAPSPGQWRAGKWHLGMFKEDYTPARRGFDEHMGYYQGCGSAWTHVSSCCTAGSADHDNKYVCASDPKWGTKDYRAYDWFKTGPVSDSAA